MKTWNIGDQYTKSGSLVVSGFGATCEKHGVPKLRLLTKCRHTRVRCHECEVEKKKARDDKYREENQINKMVRYRSNRREGHKDSEMEFMWSAEDDKKIDMFWARRGMTDEIAREKFGSHFNWPRRRK